MKRPINEVPAEEIEIASIAVEGKPPTRREVELMIAEIQTSGGLLYPIVVMERIERFKRTDTKELPYALKAGRKRLEAAKTLGWRKIPCVVILSLERFGGNQGAIADKLATIIEKCQHKEISDYELAKAVVEMKAKWNLRNVDFADAVGLSQGYTCNLARWYRAMPPEIKEAWRNNHPLLSQAQIERMSHMPKDEAVAYFEKRLKMRSSPEPFHPGRQRERRSQRNKRASESNLIKLEQAISDSYLSDGVKQLCSSIIKFALGVSQEVPGITNYKKLSPDVLAKDAANGVQPV